MDVIITNFTIYKCKGLEKQIKRAFYNPRIWFNLHYEDFVSSCQIDSMI